MPQDVNSSYISALFFTEFETRTGKSYEFFVMFSAPDPNDEGFQENKQECIAIVTKLYNVGLVTKQQQEQQLKALESYVPLSIEFILNLAKAVRIVEETAKDKLLPFVAELEGKGIVTTKYHELQNAVQAETLSNPKQIVPYFDKGIAVNVADATDEPEAALEAVFTKIASILPEELQFTNFSISVEKTTRYDWYEEEDAYDIVFSVTHNQQRYAQSIFYCFVHKGEEPILELKRLDWQDSLQLFNKMLIDQHSPYRIYEFYNELFTEDSAIFNEYVVAVAALTRNQAQFFDYLNYQEIRYLGLNAYFKYYFEGLETAEIQKAIEAYKKLGLLNHLNQDEVKAAETTVNNNFNTTYLEVLEAFPQVVLHFDTELGNLENPYEELVANYATISHDMFKPENNTDTFDLDRDTCTISFAVGGKIFTKKLEVDSDWMDTTFFEFMNEVAATLQLPGKFYNINTKGQDAAIIYLTLEQYQTIKNKKLLEFY